MFLKTLKKKCLRNKTIKKWLKNKMMKFFKKKTMILQIYQKS